MSRPTISVVTITRNNLPGLQKTVASVLAQDYPPVELVIVDGASTDGTPEFLASLNLKNGRWISEPDEGIADAFNKGMGLANGDAVIFMNAGDLFVNARTLSHAIKLIPEDVNLRASVVYGDYYDVVEAEDYLASTDHQRMHLHSSIGHQASFIGRDLCLRFAYDVRLPVGMDYDYWLRLLAAKVPFIKIALPIARFDTSGINGSFDYRVHQAILDHYFVAINTRSKLTAWDAWTIFLEAFRVHLSVCLRRLVGRRVVLAAKKLLIRLGIKPGPVKAD